MEELTKHIEEIVESKGEFGHPVTGEIVKPIEDDPFRDSIAKSLLADATITPKSEQQEGNVKAARKYIVEAVAPYTKDPDTGEIVRITKIK